ncbi:MAG TPA: hypothetical protein VJU77_03565 [Chthoniobacterales bacterium]|nr:hypothetical protein [Chthoniobacterales bacterium]
MPKYQLDVAGRNYLIRFDPAERPAKHGFYTKFLIEAASPEEAEAAMVDLVRKDPGINELVCNAPDDPAMFEIEKTYVIVGWPDCARPRMGLAWFPEEESESQSGGECQGAKP